MLIKKLGTDFGGKSSLESIVQILYNKNSYNPQKHLHAPGAPFFKNTTKGKIKSQS